LEGRNNFLTATRKKKAVVVVFCDVADAIINEINSIIILNKS